jgi:hypothetical protein
LTAGLPVFDLQDDAIFATARTPLKCKIFPVLTKNFPKIPTSNRVIYRGGHHSPPGMFTSPGLLQSEPGLRPDLQGSAGIL